ncbi:NAD(P)H-dependent oxidoreductase [Alkalispirochaeta americana]|nr:NAD(P)H-dependent oxidoreductase [Alkalispirochaeta americana]
MKALVVLAHPNAGSLNHALATEAASVLEELGFSVIFHDLYAERFDPILEHREIPRDALQDTVVADHCAELRAAEGIVIIHPNWWGQPPAILKGWVDRVFRAGVAYGNEDSAGGTVEHGLLSTEFAVVLNTSETSRDVEENILGDPLETLWKNCIFRFCGVKNVHRRSFSIVMTSTPEEREGWLREARALVTRAVESAQDLNQK